MRCDKEKMKRNLRKAIEDHDFYNEYLKKRKGKELDLLTQHYVSLFGIAKEHYRKYAEWLSKTELLFAL